MIKPRTIENESQVEMEGPFNHRDPRINPFGTEYSSMSHELYSRLSSLDE